jgi:hypothetical protein
VCVCVCVCVYVYAHAGGRAEGYSAQAKKRLVDPPCEVQLCHSLCHSFCGLRVLLCLFGV